MNGAILVSFGVSGSEITGADLVGPGKLEPSAPAGIEQETSKASSSALIGAEMTEPIAAEPEADGTFELGLSGRFWGWSALRWTALRRSAGAMRLRSTRAYPWQHPRVVQTCSSETSGAAIVSDGFAAATTVNFGMDCSDSGAVEIAATTTTATMATSLPLLPKRLASLMPPPIVLV